MTSAVLLTADFPMKEPQTEIPYENLPFGIILLLIKTHAAPFKDMHFFFS